MSRSHHIYAVGGRGGAFALQTWVSAGAYPLPFTQKPKIKTLGGGVQLQAELEDEVQSTKVKTAGVT